MNVLVFLGHHETNGLDEALCHIENGDNVFLLSCDKQVGICVYNPYSSKLQCEMCQRVKKTLLKKYAPNIKHIFASKYITKEKLNFTQKQQFKYNSTVELKNITFHGVEIGYGALSTYVTLTRITNPQFDSSLKEYLDFLMRKEILLTLVLEDLIKEISPDLIIFHNGRFAQYKPLLGVAKRYNINYVSTEVSRKLDGIELKNNTYNDYAHSPKAIAQKVFRDWDMADVKDREEIGHSFFTKRRYGQFAGDVVFTANQVHGILPEGFDESKENIAIFNSSEDEYVAVSKEYDEGRLYYSQYVALKALFERFKDDKTKHFYLRIHPNLEKVIDASHQRLYTLVYDNVTILNPTSSISSYTLMDNCSKVIVFNSTMGAESAYWGKPVIALYKCEYLYLDIVYVPSSEEEFFSLVDTPNLPSKKNENALKYGFHLLRVNYKPNKHFRNLCKKKKLLGIVPLQVIEPFEFCGSATLLAFMIKLINKLAKFGISSRFKKIPSNRERWDTETKD